MAERSALPAVEWQTLVVAVATYVALAAGFQLLATGWPVAGFVVLALGMTQHSSLTHEVIHGHPFRSVFLSSLIVRLPVGLLVPFGRFRDTHLAHHMDARLTDPYDDPESNFFDPGDWEAMPFWRQAVHRFNNTLMGRILIGPALSCIALAKCDIAAVRAGDAQIRRDWIEHVILAAGVLVVVAAMVGGTGLMVYLAAAYAAYGILKIRTYLEHRAVEKAPERSVVVESRGLLSLLFLNNNYHAVHHMHPMVPWYELPRIYARNRARYLERNGDYRYRDYLQIFGAHFLRAKDPNAHPLWRRAR